MTEKQMISTLKGLTFGTVVGSKGVEALEMAIKALSQEPCDNATLKDIFCMGCEYREQEPCDDTVSIRKDILKCRVGKIVAYNVEWLKNHWQMEMDIVCGVKPCEDAISREDAIKAVNNTLAEYIPYFRNDQIGIPLKCARALNDLSSVTQKSAESEE